jgi:hypothetical protein
VLSADELLRRDVVQRLMCDFALDLPVPCPPPIALPSRHSDMKKPDKQDRKYSFAFRAAVLTLWLPNPEERNRCC